MSFLIRDSTLDVVNQIKNKLNFLSDIFDFGPKTIVGLDIGQNSVKACVLDRTNRKNNYKLVYFKRVILSEGAIIEDEIHKEDEIIAAIQKAVQGAGKGVTKICMGLSGPSTISRRLQLAGGTLDEIEDQVGWEAEQYIPFNIEESTVSFHLIGDNEGGGVDVIIAAARNSIIETFKDLINRAGFKAKIIDLKILACVNLVDYVYERQLSASNSEEDESVIIMDIGSQSTQFVICRHNTIVFTKEILMGGGMITEEIQRQMGVNYYDAENLKIVGDGNGNFPEEVMEVVEQVTKTFLADIKKTIEFYITSTSDESFSKIFITGGGALTPGLVEGLETTLGLRVEFINPFERIEYSKSFSENQLEEIGVLGVAAMGLAMRRLF